MAVDWLKIRNEYINGGGSQRQIAEKHGIPYPTLRDRANAEGWKKAKDEHRKNIIARTDEKTAEKIADNEAEVAAIRSRLRLKFMQEIENRIENADSDGMEFRRLVQSYKDMCEITDGIGGTEEHDDGFLDALNGTAGEDWNDEATSESDVSI